MKNLKPIFIVLFIAVFSAGCDEVHETDLIESSEEVASGAYSNYPGNGELNIVINSISEFRSEWEKIYTGTRPMKELPAIDFNSRMVVLLALESKPSGGYGITDVEVTNSGNRIQVSYSEVQPGEGCVTTRAITRPYTFLSLPDSGKDVQFLKKDVIINNCNR